MYFAIAKMSSKGQIVIPGQLREDMQKGDEFLMIRDWDRLILKNMKAVACDLKEDISFARSIEESWKERDRGEFITSHKDDFLKELHEC